MKDEEDRIHSEVYGERQDDAAHYRDCGVGEGLSKNSAELNEWCAK